MTQAVVESREDGTRTTISVRGEVDLANHEAVEQEINQAISNQITLVELDLTDVAFIDSAGLRSLFGLVSRLNRLQITLELVAPEPSPARRVIELSGLESMVTVRSERSGR